VETIPQRIAARSALATLLRPAGAKHLSTFVPRVPLGLSALLHPWLQSLAPAGAELPAPNFVGNDKAFRPGWSTESRPEPASAGFSRPGYSHMELLKLDEKCR
jgi:hypothetical protein